MKNVHNNFREHQRSLADRSVDDHARFLDRTRDSTYDWVVDNVWASVHTEVYTSRRTRVVRYASGIASR